MTITIRRNPEFTDLLQKNLNISYIFYYGCETRDRSFNWQQEIEQHKRQEHRKKSDNQKGDWIICMKRLIILRGPMGSGSGGILLCE